MGGMKFSANSRDACCAQPLRAIAAIEKESAEKQNPVQRQLHHDLRSSTGDA